MGETSDGIRPFYFKDSDAEPSEDESNHNEEHLFLGKDKVRPAQLAPQPAITTYDDEDGRAWEENESKFWPASSQITFSKYVPVPVTDAKPSQLVLDESGELMALKNEVDNGQREYANMARLQAEDAQSALRGLGAADMYLKMPVSKLRQSPTLKGPILNSASHPLNRSADAKPKDVFFKYLYYGNMGFMLTVGLLICLIFPSDVRDGILKSPTLYRVVMESAKAFTSVITFSLGVSIFLALMMQQFTETIVYGLVGFVPVSCALVTIWALAEFFHNDPGSSIGHAYLYFVVILGFLGTMASSALIHWNREAIQKTTKLTRTAATILSSNPTVYFASLLILVCYLAFVSLWTVFFAHLMLLGHVETIEKPELIKYFQLSAWSYLFQAYFVFMLVWTTSIFSNVQKAMVSGVVSRWYFYHEDPAYVTDTSPAIDALQEALTRYFGQICLGSLVIAGVKSFRLGFWAYRKATARFQGRLASGVLSAVGSVVLFLEKLVEHVTDFAVYYVALSGESFCKSGRSAVRIFKRNAVLGLTTDLIAQMIFSLTTIVVAVLCGLTSYTFASHSMHSQYAWASGVLFGLLSWYILQLFADIYSDTLDVTFLCYAIDLDTDKMHSTAVHEAYGAREEHSLFN